MSYGIAFDTAFGGAWILMHMHFYCHLFLFHCPGYFLLPIMH